MPIVGMEVFCAVSSNAGIDFIIIILKPEFSSQNSHLQNSPLDVSLQSDFSSKI